MRQWSRGPTRQLGNRSTLRVQSLLLFLTLHPPTAVLRAALYSIARQGGAIAHDHNSSLAPPKVCVHVLRDPSGEILRDASPRHRPPHRGLLPATLLGGGACAPDRQGRFQAPTLQQASTTSMRAFPWRTCLAELPDLTGLRLRRGSDRDMHEQRMLLLLRRLLVKRNAYMIDLVVETHLSVRVVLRSRIAIAVVVIVL